MTKTKQNRRWTRKKEKKERKLQREMEEENKRKNYRRRWKSRKTTEGDGRGKENYRRWTREEGGGTRGGQQLEVDEKNKKQTQRNMNE